MSEHDDMTTSEHEESGALHAEFDALLADASMWDEPGPDLGDRIVAAIHSESALGDPAIGAARPLRGRTWLRPALLGAAAAIVFLFGGVVVLSALSGVDDVDTFSSELTSTGLIADVGGDIEISPLDSGLRIDLVAPGLPRRDGGAFYEAWVRTVDGELIPVGTFHDADDVILWAGIELDRIDLFTITLETAQEPKSPDQASSGDVVLRAAIDG